MKLLIIICSVASLLKGSLSVRPSVRVIFSSSTYIYDNSNCRLITSIIYVLRSNHIVLYIYSFIIIEQFRKLLLLFWLCGQWSWSPPPSLLEAKYIYLKDLFLFFISVLSGLRRITVLATINALSQLFGN